MYLIVPTNLITSYITIHCTNPVRNRKSKGKSKKDAEAVSTGDIDAVDGAVAGTENGNTSSPDQESDGRMSCIKSKHLSYIMMEAPEADPHNCRLAGGVLGDAEGAAEEAARRHGADARAGRGSRRRRGRRLRKDGRRRSEEVVRVLASTICH